MNTPFVEGLPMPEAAVYSAIAASCSAACALLNLLLARRVLKDAHEYNRRRHAIELVQAWDRDTLKARIAILTRWAELLDRNETIPWKEIEAFRLSQVTSPGQSGPSPITITDHMACVLNHLEIVASAVLHHTADDGIVRASYKGTLKRWVTLLDEYRKHIRNARGFDPWATIDRLAPKWGEPELPYSPTG